MEQVSVLAKRFCVVGEREGNDMELRGDGEKKIQGRKATDDQESRRGQDLAKTKRARVRRCRDDADEGDGRSWAMGR